jgi:hypothetical protein
MNEWPMDVVGGCGWGAPGWLALQQLLLFTLGGYSSKMKQMHAHAHAWGSCKCLTDSAAQAWDMPKDTRSRNQASTQSRCRLVGSVDSRAL